MGSLEIRKTLFTSIRTRVCMHSHRHILTLVITIIPEAHSGEVHLEQGWLALIRIDEC